MASQINSVARDILNLYRCDLGAYKIAVDDPLLSALKEECALTDSEMESIQNCASSCASMCALIDYLNSRITPRMFILFIGCVGSIMKMPDLQMSMLKEFSKDLASLI